MVNRFSAPVLALAWGLYGTAFAHAHIDSAVPPVDGTVRSAPAQVQISFTEALEPALSSARVEDAAGKRVDKGDAKVSAANSRALAIGLQQPLPPGIYTVHWSITSVDTHRTEGSYQFTVRP